MKENVAEGRWLASFSPGLCPSQGLIYAVAAAAVVAAAIDDGGGGDNDDDDDSFAYIRTSILGFHHWLWTSGTPQNF